MLPKQRHARGTMKERRKIELLGMLRELLSQDVHPMLRDAGMTEAETQELSGEGFVVLGDQGPQIADACDRYVIAELTGKAIVFLTAQKVHRQQHVVTHAPERSLPAVIAGDIGGRLWNLMWEAAKLMLAGVAGWYLHKFFP